jgi:hypothetical protein
LSMTGNFAMRSDTAGLTSNCWAYMNIITGTAWAGVIFGNSADSTFINNKFLSNIINTASSYQLIYFQGNGYDSTKGNILDGTTYIGVTVLHITALHANLGQNYTSITTWKSASFQDAHSTFTIPMVVTHP